MRFLPFLGKVLAFVIGLIICQGKPLQPPLTVGSRNAHFDPASKSFPRDASLSTNARRALANAPDGYAPERGNCPSNRPVVRDATSLSPSETSWLETRRNNTVGAMRDLLGRLNIVDFDAHAYIDNHADNVSALPNIAIAASGGGYRALLNGGGAVAAFDSRIENSTSPGQLGGLLQSATYLSGLSGGSWLVGSLYINNFTTTSAILSDTSSSIWELGESILEGPSNDSSYWRQLFDAVDAKSDAGFNVSITDYWGRALSYQLINATDGGLAYTWSSIALQPEFVKGNMPMPIVLAEERAPGELLISPNTTVYEFNPWEFGTFDPSTNGFVPLEYLGSNFSGGTLPESERCVRGFDNAGYVMGTSSSLFNQFLLQINGTDIPDWLKNAVTSILADVGEANFDIATYTPNPFYQYHTETSDNAQSKTLFLVDGGEDLQNIPLHPLIQPVRHVDVIFAIDSSADTTTYWPNGTSMVAVYERNLNASGIGNGTVFPAVPDVNSFVNLGLNSRPTFFGCNSSNQTGPSPLIVYVPNSPYVYDSNVSTFKLSYDDEERDGVVLNGYNVVTMGNSSRDAEWPTCVGCAILSRSLERTGTYLPDVCQKCFERYCWDGAVNSTTPLPYYPEMIVKSTSGAQFPTTPKMSTLALLGLLAMGLSALF